MDAHILFALIPAIFLLFALALAAMGWLDRRTQAAWWGAAAFALAALGVSLDAIRPPGASWGLLHLHLLVITAFAKALAERHRRPLPLPFLVLVVGTAVATTALGAAAASLTLRQGVFNAGLLVALVELTRQLRAWDRRRGVDRLVIAMVAGLGASYAAKLGLLVLDPLSDSLSGQASFFAIGANLVFHAVMAVSGCAAGLILLLVLGWDYLEGQAARLRTDPLTGAGNRHALAEAIRSEEQGEWSCGGVLVVDLDHFKRINDRFGHAGGDAVLAAAARSMSRAIEGKARLFRTGGEEFVILADGAPTPPLADMAELARCAVATAGCVHRGEPIPVTASVGFCARAAGDPIERVIECADQALYEAKGKGRNCAVPYRDGDRPRVALQLVS